MGQTEASPRGFFGAVRQAFRADRPLERSEPCAHRLRTPPKDIAGYPLAERLKQACEALPLNGIEERVVTALLRKPGADSKALSEACGLGGAVWHTHFAALCQKREGWIWPASLPDEPDARFLPGVLAEYRAQSGSFTLRPEVAQAFRRMGLG